MRTFAIAIFVIAILDATPWLASAADDTHGGSATCCDQCGRHTACVQKTCQVVCEVKKETRTCWCVECTEICPLLPGFRDCGDKCPPPPRCGNPKCVKKLVKKEYQVEVPVYRCVVRNLCQECLKGGSITNPPGATPGPPAAPTAPPMPPAPTVPPPPAGVPR